MKESFWRSSALTPVDPNIRNTLEVACRCSRFLQQPPDTMIMIATRNILVSDSSWSAGTIPGGMRQKLQQAQVWLTSGEAWGRLCSGTALEKRGRVLPLLFVNPLLTAPSWPLPSPFTLGHFLFFFFFTSFFPPFWNNIDTEKQGKERRRNQSLQKTVPTYPSLPWACMLLNMCVCTLPISTQTYINICMCI